MHSSYAMFIKLVMFWNLAEWMLYYVLFQITMIDDYNAKFANKLTPKSACIYFSKVQFYTRFKFTN